MTPTQQTELARIRALATQAAPSPDGFSKRDVLLLLDHIIEVERERDEARRLLDSVVATIDPVVQDEREGSVAALVAAVESVLSFVEADIKAYAGEERLTALTEAVEKVKSNETH